MQPGVENAKSDHGSLSCDKIAAPPLACGDGRLDTARSGCDPLVIDLIPKANGNLAGGTDPSRCPPRCGERSERRLGDSVLWHQGSSAAGRASYSKITGRAEESPIS